MVRGREKSCPVTKPRSVSPANLRELERLTAEMVEASEFDGHETIAGRVVSMVRGWVESCGLSIDDEETGRETKVNSTTVTLESLKYACDRARERVKSGVVDRDGDMSEEIWRQLLGCDYSPISSRACEQGTRGCETRHTPAPVQAEGPREPEPFATFRQITGAPHEYNAYVYVGNRVVMSCDHRHGRKDEHRGIGFAHADACAKDMLAKYKASLPVSAAAGRPVLSSLDKLALQWLRKEVEPGCGAEGIDREAMKMHARNVLDRLLAGADPQARPAATTNAATSSSQFSSNANAAPPTAETVPLTVGAALMLPGVRSGAKWVEYERPNGCGGTLPSVIAVDDGVIRRTHAFNRGDQFFDWKVAIRSTDLDATCVLADPAPPVKTEEG